jgi:hypothetical protein
MVGVGGHSEWPTKNRHNRHRTRPPRLRNLGLWELTLQLAPESETVNEPWRPSREVLL